jgi:hypothetical protein
MARQLDHPSHQIRVLFAASEAQSFLRGGAHMPGGGGGDPLSRAIARTMKELTLDLALAAECIEIVVEPAPELVDGQHAWYAVRFRFGDEAVMTAGEDPRVLADWIAANTPDLAFAVEQERAVPLYREPA